MGFGLVGLLNVLHNGYYHHVSGTPLLLGRVALREVPSWIAWALLVPAVVRWGERFRLDWPPRPGVVLAHVAGAAVATAVFAIVPTVIEQTLGLAADGVGFMAELRDNLIYQSPTGAIAYGATLGFGYAEAHRARTRQLLELHHELSKAQLAALRMQLNPHFFFNTLHTIGALVRDGDRDGAVEMIERLGDILHRVLHRDGDPEAPLSDEIELLRTYLAIEQVRFGERLRVVWDVAPASEPVPVPQLILQPLIENALRHGLSRRARPGSLTISSRVVGDDRLELVVADDGDGLPADFATRASSGVGLANVRARLRQLYGDAAQLSLASPGEGGVTARIELPVRGRA